MFACIKRVLKIKQRFHDMNSCPLLLDLGGAVSDVLVYSLADIIITDMKVHMLMDGLESYEIRTFGEHFRFTYIRGWFNSIKSRLCQNIGNSIKS